MYPASVSHSNVPQADIPKSVREQLGGCGDVKRLPGGERKRACLGKRQRECQPKQGEESARRLKVAERVKQKAYQEESEEGGAKRCEEKTVRKGRQPVREKKKKKETSLQKGRGYQPAQRRELQCPDHPRGSVTMSLLFLLLLLHGVAPGTQGLSLCGWRKQLLGGNKLRYSGSSGDDVFTVLNTEEALIVRSSVLSYDEIILQPQAGPYTFCVHWIPGLRIFNFTYGVTKSWNVPASLPTRRELPQEAPPSYTCNPDNLLINCTINGRPLVNSCNFSFSLQSIDTDTKSVEHEISQVSDYLGKEHFNGSGRILLCWIDDLLSNVTLDEDRHHFGKGSLQAAVYKLHSSDVLNSIPDRFGVSLSFPKLLLETIDPGTRLQVVRIRGSGAIFQDPANSTVMGSQVVGITLQGTQVSNLSEDIVITFYHQLSQVNSSSIQLNPSPVCKFWDELSEAWKTDGCCTVPGEGYTDCRCNHLTYFALLMSMSNEVISEEHLVSLSVLTFVGCSISALSCFFTIIWICCSRKMHSNPTLQIHVNLLVAVLLLDLSFIVSAVLGALEEHSLCISSAAVLHFSLLCTFSWMAIEGFNLYRLVVKVFAASSITTVKLGLGGWGVPIFTVIAVALICQESYGVYYIPVERPHVHNSTAAICWLTDPIIQTLNLGFCAAILAFNFCMMVAMTRRVLRLSPHTRAEKIRHCITLLGLSCMLGLPWCLAFFSYGALILPVQYLFSILNALQGFFIFLWYCALSQPSAKNQSHTSDCTSATPASPRADQIPSSDHKKLLG
ncbi:adhesion G-protein coupled receptor G1-like [Hyla sarda]|uniref:adhesion G-protein coupled receptor G1-like n=1 Tax=Hyla sarda TaxID=327740 RepID=UPI0024C3E861|nr:adhesion G-protein coupled receptor G1-like [Hyla sarda]